MDHSSKVSPTEVNPHDDPNPNPNPSHPHPEDKPTPTDSTLKEAGEKVVVVGSRWLSTKQRLLVVAILGTCLSGLMTFSLIYLLNKIRG